MSVRYGYARGNEAQHYVNNIRQYQETLQWVVAQKENKIAEMKAIEEAKALEIADQNKLKVQKEVK